MRPRDEILREAAGHPDVLIVEVLLDIRALLRKILEMDAARLDTVNAVIHDLGK